MFCLLPIAVLSLLLATEKVQSFTAFKHINRVWAQTSKYPLILRHSTLLHAKRDFSPPVLSNSNSNGDISSSSTTEGSSSSNNGLVYTVDLPKRAGIEWGSDLSFRWIYVRGLEEGGEAERTGLIRKGEIMLVDIAMIISLVIFYCYIQAFC